MIIGISITKSVLFRGVQQEFSNVYHYYLAGAQTAPADSLINEIVTTEKTLHSVDVAFLRGQCWDASGTPEQNEMLSQLTLTGNGSSAANSSMDRERAILIRWPAGLSSTGKPVYLRKWYHSCGSFGGTAIATGNLQNTLAFTSTQRTAMASAASAFNDVGIAEAWVLCAKSGRVWQAQPQAHAWLEHHQLGDMWR